MGTTKDTILGALRRELSEAHDNLCRCRLQLRAFDRHLHSVGRTDAERDQYE
jgi:hypothetical protein